MRRGAQRPGEDTGYQHLALDGCMAGWHRVGPPRGLLLNPVTLRDEGRRWEDDAAAGDGGARQHATEVQAQPVAGSRTAKWPNASGRKLILPPQQVSTPLPNIQARRHPTGTRLHVHVRAGK